MKEKLIAIEEAAFAQLNSGADPEDVRIRFLGKKGELTLVLRGMGALSKEERPVIGALANEVRTKIENAIAEMAKKKAEKEEEAKLEKEKIDVTIPGKTVVTGARHPLAMAEEELCKVFMSMGFDRVDGPEVEYDYYNFQKLNMPENHPARDTQDTFYITKNILLRSQTSPVQVRTMEKRTPPIRIISPGRVYRSDEVDATHSPVFHQMEGLVVDKGITMGDLKGMLELFAKKYFGEDIQLRFRPHHFPFTEPSAEVDVSCVACHGKGCRVCKGEGWIEILGAGMVHPTVLEGCGIDSSVYSGFAFGLGIERVVMKKWNIDDMRYLYENDIRFLKQFK